MNIEKNRIGNEVFVSKEYCVNGKTVTVKVKQFDQDDRYVWGALFRSQIKTSYGIIDPQLLCDMDEFFQDLDFLFSQVENKDLTKQTIWDSYYALCLNHIKQYGRLIDTDLEGYLDSSMHLTDALSNVINSPMTTELGVEVRNEFKSLTYEVFKEYIWINQRTPDMLPHQPSNIVKYTDSI